MSDREPVLRDFFKVKKGLFVTGDAYITGNLTLSGDFAWMNPDALLTIGNIETTNLSAGRLYSSNDELVVVPFGPDYTILHPLSVVDETVFESAVQMETDLWVKGNLRVDGNAYLSAGVDGVINVGDTNTDNVVFNADIQSSLIPDTTDTYDLGSVDQHWDTLYVHDISAHGSVDIEDNLFVSGTTTLSGALSAGSDATLSSNLTVSADTTIGGNTTLSGTFSAAGDSKIDSDLHVVGDLRVDGDVWFNANNTNGTNTINLGDDNTDNVVFNADVDSDIIPDKTLTNTLGISSQQWLELFVQDISATGDVTISDTLNVSGDTNIVGDISATGIGVFDDDVHIKGDLRVDGNAYLSAGSSGSINIGDINTDNIVFVADVSSNILPDESDKYDLGSATQQWRELFVKDISATGDLTSTGTLTVSSDTIIGGTTTLSGTLSTVSDAKFDEDVHIVGDLRVDGDVWFNANNTGGTNTINLGDDNTDNVVFNADIDSDIIPDDNITFDLGSATQQWRELHTQDVSISRDLSSNRHVNFPNLSAGGLSGNFVSIQSDGELTTSSISVDAIKQVGTVVNTTSANWNSVYTDVSETSAEWDSVYSSVCATSAEWNSVYSYVNDTSATNSLAYNDTRFVNVTGDTMTGDLDLGTNKIITRNVTTGIDSGFLTLAGGTSQSDGAQILLFGDNNTNPNNNNRAQINADNIFIGDVFAGGSFQPWMLHVDVDNEQIILGGLSPLNNSDISVYGTTTVSGDVLPDASMTYDLGSANQHWSTLYVHDVSAHGSVSANGLTVVGDISASGDIYAANHSLIFSDGNPANDTSWSKSDSITAKRVAGEWDGIHDDGSLIIPVSASVAGDFVAVGNVTLGQPNTTIMLGQVGSDIIPSGDNNYNFGSLGARWKSAAIQEVNADKINTTGVSAGDVYFAPLVTEDTLAPGSSPSQAESNIPYDPERLLSFSDLVSSRDTTSIVQANSASWRMTENTLTRGAISLDFQSGPIDNIQHHPEFITMGNDNPAGDAQWNDINYTHVMVLPYDTYVKKIILRAAASSGATVNIGIHTNEAETNYNSIEYKYFSEYATMSAEHSFDFNNQSKSYIFDDTVIEEGSTLGISLSGTKPISTAALTIVLQYRE